MPGATVARETNARMFAYHASARTIISRPIAVNVYLTTPTVFIVLPRSSRSRGSLPRPGTAIKNTLPSRPRHPYIQAEKESGTVSGRRGHRRHLYRLRRARPLRAHHGHQGFLDAARLRGGDARRNARRRGAARDVVRGLLPRGRGSDPRNDGRHERADP